MKKNIIIILFIISISLFAQSSKWENTVTADPITDAKIILFSVDSSEKGAFEYSYLLVRYEEGEDVDIYIVWNNLDFVYENHKVIFRFDTDKAEELICGVSDSSKASFVSSRDVKNIIEKIRKSKKLVVRGNLHSITATVTFDVSGFEKIERETLSKLKMKASDF